MVETIGAFQCVNNLLFLSDNTERKVNHWSIWYGIYIVCELKKYWICVIVFDFEKEKKIILYVMFLTRLKDKCVVFELARANV